MVNMREMRRKDKEITDRDEIDRILHSATVLRLGLSDDGQPYIVPLSFGYDGRNIYIHSAKDGYKLDILRKNSRVCFETEIDVELIKNDDPCEFGVKYKSVIGFGEAVFLDCFEDKKSALDAIVSHYAGKPMPMNEKAINAVTVLKIEINGITGKKAG